MLGKGSVSIGPNQVSALGADFFFGEFSWTLLIKCHAGWVSLFGELTVAPSMRTQYAFFPLEAANVGNIGRSQAALLPTTGARHRIQCAELSMSAFDTLGNPHSSITAARVAARGAGAAGEGAGAGAAASAGAGAGTGPATKTGANAKVVGALWMLAFMWILPMHLPNGPQKASSSTPSRSKVRPMPPEGSWLNLDLQMVFGPWQPMSSSDEHLVARSLHLLVNLVRFAE